MATSRLSALCEQTVLTGVDVIQVVDPLVQTVLRVFFVVEPSALDVPLVDGAQLTPPAPNASEGPLLAENALGRELRELRFMCLRDSHRIRPHRGCSVYCAMVGPGTNGVGSPRTHAPCPSR